MAEQFSPSVDYFAVKHKAFIRARFDRGGIRVEVLPLTRYVPSVEEHRGHLHKLPDDQCHIPREPMTKHLPKT